MVSPWTNLSSYAKRLVPWKVMIRCSLMVNHAGWSFQHQYQILMSFSKQKEPFNTNDTMLREYSLGCLLNKCI